MKNNTTKIGKNFENVAAAYLVKKGYKLLKKNWRCVVGELDLIFDHDGVLVFVEVKGINSDSVIQPDDQLTALKRKKLVAAIYTFLSIEASITKRWQLDFVGVVFGSRGFEVKHFEDILSFFN